MWFSEKNVFALFLTFWVTLTLPVRPEMVWVFDDFIFSGWCSFGHWKDSSWCVFSSVDTIIVSTGFIAYMISLLQCIIHLTVPPPKFLFYPHPSLHLLIWCPQHMICSMINPALHVTQLNVSHVTWGEDRHPHWVTLIILRDDVKTNYSAWSPDNLIGHGKSLCP